MLADIFDNAKMKEYWSKRIERAFKNKINTWDYQWLYSIIVQNGLCVTPYYNLVTNIGFDDDAIHTKIDSHGFSKYKTVEIDMLTINRFVIPNKKADLSNMKNVFNPNFLKKLFIKYLEISNCLKGHIKDIWIGLG